MLNERQYATGSSCLKDVAGNVVVGENGTKDTWKKYTCFIKTWQYICDHNSGKTRLIFIIFALL